MAHGELEDEEKTNLVINQLAENNPESRRYRESRQYESQMSMTEMGIHELSIFSVIAYFGTSPNEGLNSEQVIRNAAEGGSNVIYTSSFSCCPCIPMEGSNHLPKTVKVTRDGSISIIDAKDLVKGDVVDIRKGQKISADIRLIKADDLMVDNTILGYLEGPVVRTAECDSENEEPLDMTNMVYAGTMCTSGKGKGVVVDIGMNTILGKMQLEAAQPKKVTCIIL